MSLNRVLTRAVVATRQSVLRSAVCPPAALTSAFSIVLPAHSTPIRLFATKSPYPKKPTKLVGAELTKAIGSLDGWNQLDPSHPIVKKYTFTDFNTAFGVMTRVALLAEKMNHHPEWSNVYNQLKVSLSTHDVNGVSDWDIYMAQQIDHYVNQVQPKIPKL